MSVDAGAAERILTHSCEPTLPDSRIRLKYAFAFVSLILGCPIDVRAQDTFSLPVETSAARARRPLALSQTQYRLRVGDASKVDAPPETLDFLRSAKVSLREPSLTGDNGFVMAPALRGGEMMLAASTNVEPGEHRIAVSAVSETGEERSVEIDVVVEPLLTVPSTATKPPVVLVSGWSFSSILDSCPISNKDGTDTFGSLASALYADGIPAVYYFDNCVQCPNCRIEDIGNALGIYLNTIRYDTGVLAPQIDLIGHSMGGLISRSYLAGLQSDGSPRPLENPRIRKLITIATPHLGSFLTTAPLARLAGPFFGAQTNQLIPGSPFLWNLGTWNQRGDDLRGVDAIAIIGNRGFWKGDLGEASDGIVSTASASLGFTRDASRTRILPYCHTEQDMLDEATWFYSPTCTGPSIADVDRAPLTGQIIRSFLADTPAWRSIGGTPASDQWLSQYGGIYFANQTAEARWVTDLTRVSFGSVSLDEGGNSGTNFFGEFIKGTGVFQFTSSSLGSFTCGPWTIFPGFYSPVRCKSSPVVSSVRPLLPNTTAWIVQSGTTITVNGSGFGQICSACRLLAVPMGSTLGYPLQISSWSDQAIKASFPETYKGLVRLIVRTAAGTDSINVMAGALPPPPSPVISASPSALQFTYTIGSTTPAGQAIRLTNSGGGTLTWSASSTGAPWLNVTPASGTAPSTLTASVVPAGLLAGTYRGTITISATGTASQSIAVTLTVSTAAAPGPILTSVVNAASFQPGMARGGIATVFGKGLSPVNGVEFPGGATVYKGVTVSVQGRLAPLLGVADVGGAEQINFQVPFDLASPSFVRLEVNNNGSVASLDSVRVSTAQPGIFEYVPQGSSLRYVAAVKSDGSVVGPGNPLSGGETVSMFLTGMGLTSPVLQTGQIGPSDPLAVTVARTFVSVADIAARVFFSGYAPGFIGLYQINFAVPVNVPSGSAVNLNVTISGIPSQTSRLAIR